MNTKEILTRLNQLIELKEEKQHSLKTAQEELANIYAKPFTHQFQYLINHYKKLELTSIRHIKTIDNKFNELKVRL